MSSKLHARLGPVRCRRVDGVRCAGTALRARRHVFADGPAVVDGDRTRTWAQLYDRCARLGDALRKQGCGRGDVVQCMLDNTAEMVEAQQGVAMSGATFGSVNTRLDAATVAYVLEHSDARLFIADERYEATCREALATLENPPPLVVVGGRADGYEALVESGDAAAPWTPPEDEWDALALNYTSGTTGRPKGVVVHHRGAYVQALSNAIDFGGLPADGGTRYLWTLPMFHCARPVRKTRGDGVEVAATARWGVEVGARSPRRVTVATIARGWALRHLHRQTRRQRATSMTWGERRKTTRKNTQATAGASRARSRPSAARTSVCGT